MTDETDYAVRTHRENRRTDDSVRRRVEPVDDEALLYRHVFTETGDGRVTSGRSPSSTRLTPNTTPSSPMCRSAQRTTILRRVLRRRHRAHQHDYRGPRYQIGQPGSYHLVGRNPRAYTDQTDNDLLVDENGDAYSIAVAMAAAGRFAGTVGAADSDRLDGLYSDGDLPDPVESIDGTNLVLIGRLDSGTESGTRSRSASRDG